MFYSVFVQISHFLTLTVCVCVCVGCIIQPVRRLWFFRADLICAARWIISHSSGTTTSRLIITKISKKYWQTCVKTLIMCVFSKCGGVPPESCWFSLLCSAASFLGERFIDSVLNYRNISFSFMIDSSQRDI